VKIKWPGNIGCIHSWYTYDCSKNRDSIAPAIPALKYRVNSNHLDKLWSLS
jgi:hypothetical protein